jgi:3-oxoadipate enol-lactonase
MMSAVNSAKLFSRTIPLQPPARAKDAELTPQSSVSLQIKCYKPLDQDPLSPTVLFLPFWGGSASTYEAVQVKLSETRPAHGSIAVSYRGTGDSTHTEHDTPEDNDIPALAVDVLALLDILRGDNDDGLSLIPSRKLVLCVHSMSAKVAWEVLSGLHAGGETLEVTGLLLLAPAPVGPLVLPPEIRKQQLGAFESSESVRWTLENMIMHKVPDNDTLEKLASNAAGMSSAAKRGWVELGMQRESLEAVRNVATGLEGGSKLASFKVVALLGEQDKVETVEKVTRETVDVLTELGFAVCVRVIPGVGHLLPVEAPEEVVFELGKML